MSKMSHACEERFFRVLIIAIINHCNIFIPKYENNIEITKAIHGMTLGIFLNLKVLYPTTSGDNIDIT